MDEIVAATIVLGQFFTPEIKNALFIPVANRIGQCLGTMWDGAFKKHLSYYEDSVENEIVIQKHASSIQKGVNSIEEENLQEPRICVVGPAFESSRFFLAEESCRQMFEKLIVASCDKRYNGQIHPVFSEIIKQLSPLDAKLLKSIYKQSDLKGLSLFKDNVDYPLIETNLIYEYGIDVISQSVSNLSRLGIINIQSFYDTLTSITIDDNSSNELGISLNYQDGAPSDDDTDLIRFLRSEGFIVLNARCCFSKLGSDFVDICIK